MGYDAHYTTTGDFALFTAKKLDSGVKYYRWPYVERLLFEIIVLRAEVQRLKLEICCLRAEKELS